MCQCSSTSLKCKLCDIPVYSYIMSEPLSLKHGLDVQGRQVDTGCLEC